VNYQVEENQWNINCFGNIYAFNEIIKFTWQRKGLFY